MSTFLTIKSSLRDYPIILNSDTFKDLFSYIRSDLKKKKIYLVIDEFVFTKCSSIKKQIDAHSDSDIRYFILPQGEATKSLSHADSVYEWLLKNTADRDSVICAVGGGVIGDAVGFVASTYMRGISFVQVPTTLLSMVDSSVGGKVGINHQLGKNMIGSFYPPHAVFIDIDFLKTLSNREFSAGLAECVKHGLISSRELAAWYMKNANAILSREENIIKDLISQNIKIKANIVEQDEKEENVRAYLNFGHTFAHAIEKAFSYSGKILHGEAVSLGMCAALELSKMRFSISETVSLETQHLLNTFKLPTKFQLPDFEILYNAMKVDKKNKEGLIRFVLLKDVGQVEMVNDISKEELMKAYKSILL